MSELRVGVAGALGRLGRVACTAVDAAEDLHLASAFGRRGGMRLSEALGFGGDGGFGGGGDGVGGDGDGVGGDALVYDDAEAFAGANRLDVIVDCTVYPITIDIARAAIDAGVSPVIGATGWTDEDLVVLGELCDECGVPAMYVPNFSFGAVLMMRFASQAARVFPRAEIIELHHDAKRDAPSGTAKLTARRIHEAGAPLPPIHSVRLPGLVAHQETIFGGPGETLTIRHDSLSRESFAPGILAAIRAVRTQQGLVIGLDAIVEKMVSS